MRTTQMNQDRDRLAAIGIGAMIVFIALILVAAVASAVIIQTGEKLQQNAQATGQDTTDSLAGRINILGVSIKEVAATGADFGADPGDAVKLTLTFKTGAGSDEIEKTRFASSSHATDVEPALTLASSSTKASTSLTSKVR